VKSQFTSNESDVLRHHLGNLLNWEDAHADFDRAVSGIPSEFRGRQPSGLPYSPWQLLEHLRLAQKDILDFCIDSGYEERKWPDDYWPKTPGPPSEGAWEKSVDGFRKDLKMLQDLADDRTLNLFSKVPNGTGQTYLRELLLVADHNAYHIGQLVIVRRLLGVWS
jgi:hypothetical protein